MFDNAIDLYYYGVKKKLILQKSTNQKLCGKLIEVCCWTKRYFFCSLLKISNCRFLIFFEIYNKYYINFMIVFFFLSQTLVSCAVRGKTLSIIQSNNTLLWCKTWT